MSKGKLAIDAAKKLVNKLTAIVKDPDNLTGTTAQKAKQQADQEAALANAKDALKKARAEAKETPEVGKKPSTKTPTVGKQSKDEAPKVTADKEAKKKLTREKVTKPAEKQAARESESPLVRRLQAAADARTSGNKKRDFDPTRTPEEAGRSAKRIGSDFTRQQQIGMQEGFDKKMGELEWYKKNQPDNKEQMGILAREIAKLKKRGFIKVKDSYAPRKPEAEGATGAGAKPKPKSKPFTGSKRAAYNEAVKKGKKTFTFDGKTFNTAEVGKQFAAAEKAAGLNRGGVVKKRIGAHDYRMNKGGLLLSSVDNRKKK